MPKEKTLTPLAINIRRHRVRLGLSQDELGRIIGVKIETPQGAISGFEMGRRKPNPEMMKKLCELFGVDEVLLRGLVDEEQDRVLQLFKKLKDCGDGKAEEWIKWAEWQIAGEGQPQRQNDKKPKQEE
ncbi:MAG: helix-turn-helix transcriptional regulator [Syntrophobacterales bacterium]|nr:helix-turn-helix transcriptional regulator [Syntrophobacterales bacterium]